MTKHFLKKKNHGSEKVSHPVVVLLEGNDEHIYILDFLLEGCHQFLNSFLLLHQLIPKARSVNDSDPPLSLCPSQYPVSAQVSLVMLSTSLLLTWKQPFSNSSPLQFLSLPSRTLARLDFPTPVPPRIRKRGLGYFSSLFLLSLAPALLGKC